MEDAEEEEEALDRVDEMDNDLADREDIAAAQEQRDLLEAMENSRHLVRGPGDDRTDEADGR